MPEPADLQRLRQEYAARAQRPSERELYSPFNRANLFILQQRQRALLQLLQAGGFTPLHHQRILEIGCGEGGVLHEVLGYGANPRQLGGGDLLWERVSRAHARLPHLPLACLDARHLPYPAATFDLALQFTVFSSILDPTLKAALAQELMRVLKPGGAVVWYDFWLNPTNPQTRGIRPPEIRTLFPGCTLTLRRITLAPPLARRLVPLSWLCAALLEKIGLFNTHYLVLIRRP